MIDLKALRENPDLFRNSQKVRGEDPLLVLVMELQTQLQLQV
jgi:seryl-tRNA synthetase